MNSLFQILEAGTKSFDEILKEIDPKYDQLQGFERDILEAATSAVRNAATIQQEIRSGWDEIGKDSTALFDLEKLREIRRKAQRFSFGSPLVVAIVETYQLLVHAKGREVKATEDTLQGVITAYLELNKNAVFSQLERMERERNLWTDSELHYIHFTGDDSADTKTRYVAANEWDDPINNPDDKTEVWFHVRNVTSTRLNGSVKEYLAIHPDYQFIVRNRFRNEYETEIQTRYSGQSIKFFWDQPVKRLQLNKGVSKLFPVLSWVECYERLLNMIATVYAAISAVALVTRAKAEYVKKVAAELKNLKSSANPTGNNIVLEGDVKTLNAKSALLGGNDLDPFLYQISMAVQLPPHAFGRQEPATGLSDGQNSNELMRLAIQARQSLWVELERDLIEYALIQAVKRGDLKRNASIVEVDVNDTAYTERIEWAKEYTGSFDVIYPSVRTVDLEKEIRARISAHTLNGQTPNPDISTPKEYFRDVMPLLGRSDLDERVKELADQWGVSTGNEENGLEERAFSLLSSFVEQLKEAATEWEHLETFEAIQERLNAGKTVRILPNKEVQVYENGELSESDKIRALS